MHSRPDVAGSCVGIKLVMTIAGAGGKKLTTLYIGILIINFNRIDNLMSVEIYAANDVKFILILFDIN